MLNTNGCTPCTHPGTGLVPYSWLIADPVLASGSACSETLGSGPKAWLTKLPSSAKPRQVSDVNELPQSSAGSIVDNSTVVACSAAAQVGYSGGRLGNEKSIIGMHQMPAAAAGASIFIRMKPSL